MNADGYEKTIDINDGFKEISYCSLPMVDNNYLKEKDCHYYYDITSVNEADTM